MKAFQRFFTVVSSHITENRLFKVEVKNIIEERNSLLSTHKYTYEIILKCEMNKKCTNVNLWLTKSGYAEATNQEIIEIALADQFLKSLSDDGIYLKKMTKKISILEKEVKELADNPKKLHTNPENSKKCIVTNACSPGKENFNFIFFCKREKENLNTIKTSE